MTAPSRIAKTLFPCVYLFEYKLSEKQKTSSTHFWILIGSTRFPVTSKRFWMTHLTDKALTGHVILTRLERRGHRTTTPYDCIRSGFHQEQIAHLPPVPRTPALWSLQGQRDARGVPTCALHFLRRRCSAGVVRSGMPAGRTPAGIPDAPPNNINEGVLGSRFSVLGPRSYPLPTIRVVESPY